MKIFKEISLYGTLVLFVLFLFIPLYLALVAASHESSTLLQGQSPIWPGEFLWQNMKAVLSKDLVLAGEQSVWRMLVNSFVMASLIAAGKIFLAVLSAFALVYFELPFKRFFFAFILITLMLPVEVRILPTFHIVASFAWLNTFKGLSLPLMASATATFSLRQMFKSIPKELVEASKLDGAGPLRFFIDILFPLSKAQIAALFIVLFIYGWNQYLWPLVITTDSSMTTIVMGIRYIIGVGDQVPQWHYIMCIALLALIPPCFLIIVIQRWFERGLMH